MQGQRIKGTPNTIGRNCIVSSFISSQNIHFALFNKPPIQNAEYCRIAIDIMRDSANVYKYLFL